MARLLHNQHGLALRARSVADGVTADKVLPQVSGPVDELLEVLAAHCPIGDEPVEISHQLGLVRGRQMLQIDILDLHSPVFLPVKGRVLHRMANEPAQAAPLQTCNVFRRPLWHAAKTKTDPRKTQRS